MPEAAPGGAVRDILAATSHRPWPLPAGPWIMVQRWSRLLFAHWPVDADLLRPFVPAGLALDEFAGEAWLSVTSFLVTVRPRALPPAPLVSHFAELNVRTYVTRDRRPGVLFLSLDASGLLAVIGARLAYSLPYFPARADVRTDGDETHYRLCAWRPLWRRAMFEAAYRPVSGVESAAPGTLEHWLVERYRLYTTDRRGRLWYGDIHHRPWPLRRATGAVSADAVAAADGVTLPADAPLLHYAESLDVLVWPPMRVREQ